MIFHIIDNFKSQQNLFKKVVPHHCLGAVWSRRDKVGAPDAPSIQATIQQFNRISLRVIATVLKTEDLRTSVRAKIIQKWINIAQVIKLTPPPQMGKYVIFHKFFLPF